MSDAIMRLEGETFVQAELLRRAGGLTDAEVMALALGMITGAGNVLRARFGRGAPGDEAGVVELPPIGGRLRLVYCRDQVTIATAGARDDAQGDAQEGSQGDSRDGAAAQTGGGA